MKVDSTNEGRTIMTPIVVDANLADQLCKLGQPVAVSDASGKVLGHFVPVLDRSKWSSIPPAISEEELERRSKSTGKRYTTAEVIAHLESL
jgi:hypothetical protein